MKKLDKLILSSFIGPFIITFLVVVFILFNINILKYFDDLIGKGLDFDVIGRFFFYFSIFTIPTAMPLAVLLSSLIAYGNLGEHFELTAVKSAGISLTRTLLPIFFFVVGLTFLAFYVNNNLVPKAALEAYSLLWDIKQKKPALDLREGSFYNGIPNMSIKINKKFPDGITIKDVLIYDHRKGDGNRDVTIADSGRMYTIMNESYLKLELFNGYNYKEGASSEQDLTGKRRAGNANNTFSRSQFAKTQVVFDLSSFQLETTDKNAFQGNRLMRNISELQADIDSVDREIMDVRLQHYENKKGLFNSVSTAFDTSSLPDDLRQYSQLKKRKSPQVFGSEPVYVPPTDTVKKTVTDSTNRPKVEREPKPKTETQPKSDRAKTVKKKTDTKQKKKEQVSTKTRKEKGENLQKKLRLGKITLTEEELNAKLDTIFSQPVDQAMLENAANKARAAKSQVNNTVEAIKDADEDKRVFQIQWHKIFASSFACIAMFLIGAPLGAIIKKGGLGVPFLVSILFFIVYYLLTMQGDKLAKKGAIPVPVGVWAADVILFIIGLYFLRQARLDARFFEMDFYMVQVDKFKKWLAKKRLLPAQNA